MLGKGIIRLLSDSSCLDLEGKGWLLTTREAEESKCSQTQSKGIERQLFPSDIQCQFLEYLLHYTITQPRIYWLNNVLKHKCGRIICVYIYKKKKFRKNFLIPIQAKKLFKTHSLILAVMCQLPNYSDIFEMSDWLELKPCVPGGAQRLHNEPVPISLVSFEKALFV